MAGAIQLIRGRKARPGRIRRRRPSSTCAWPAAAASTHPSSYARSMIDTSISLIVTGSSLMPEHARPFARRRAQPAGELGKVVRRVQTIDRRVPLVVVDEVVPVRNQVSERASLMAERNAAVHAARALLHQVACRRRQIDLAPVVDALVDRPRRMFLSLDFDEPCWLTHEPGLQRTLPTHRRFVTC